MLKVFVVLCICVVGAAAGTIEYQWNITPSDIHIDTYCQWDALSIDGGMPAFSNGYPDLPGVTRCYVIPQGTSVTAVEVRNIRTVSICDGFLPAPVCFFPLSGDIPRNADYTDVVFDDLGVSFPVSPVTGYKTGSKTGYRLGSYFFVPFVYNQFNGGLSVIVSADISLVYDSDPDAPVYSLTETQVKLAKEGISTFIDNPDMLDTWSPSARSAADDDVEVIVVGYSQHSNQLSDLSAFHNTLGYSADTVTVQWIESNCAGFDTQEKIRNYLKDLFEGKGLLFAVICGDYGDTTRLSMLYDPWFEELMNATADLYYSDLDNTWDADGDHLYGEVEDTIDGYSDIYVGRYPVRVQEDYVFAGMVIKAIQYNTLPVEGDWRQSALLMGALLFPQYPGNDWRFGSKHCDSIAEFIPETWEIEFHYEDTTGAHPDNTLEVFNQGFAFAEYVAHGYMGGFMWYTGSEIILNSNLVWYMENGGMLPWLHGSVSCSTGKLFDPEYPSIREGFAELMVQKHNAGAIISVASSAGAYANVREPGPAGWLAIHFADLLFSGEVDPEAGVVHGLSKDAYWASSTGFNNWLFQWAIQPLNLYGDPCTRFVTMLEGIEGESGVKFEVSLAQNPVYNSVNVQIELAFPARVTMDIYDMTGRSVMHCSEYSLGTGENTVNIDVSRLTRGVYLLKTTTGSASAVEKVVILH